MGIEEVTARDGTASAPATRARSGRLDGLAEEGARYSEGSRQPRHLEDLFFSLTRATRRHPPRARGAKAATPRRAPGGEGMNPGVLTV